MQIKTFKDFIGESAKDSDKHKAGVVLIYDNKILLVHPTNSSWKSRSCGIPKGFMQDGEDAIDSALRELREETGIKLKLEQLQKVPYTVEIHGKKEVQVLTYFVCKIEDLAELGLHSKKIPKDQLQLDEVDWAKFVDAEEAYKLITQAQLIILDRHLTVSSNK